MGGWMVGGRGGWRGRVSDAERRGDEGALSRHEAELLRIGELSRDEAAEAAEE